MGSQATERVEYKETDIHKRNVDCWLALFSISKSLKRTQIINIANLMIKKPISFEEICKQIKIKTPKNSSFFRTISFYYESREKMQNIEDVHDPIEITEGLLSPIFKDLEYLVVATALRRTTNTDLQSGSIIEETYEATHLGIDWGNRIISIHDSQS